MIMGKQWDMDGYVTVSERLAAFYERYPDGSIQCDLLELTDARVVIRASAYRQPDDARPSVGHASLTIPGSTPYTRGSELENAETSAVGRALALLGFETKRGIASADEIRTKQVEDPAGDGRAHLVREEGRFIARPATREAGISIGQMLDALKAAGLDTKAAGTLGKRMFGEWQLKQLTGEQRAAVLEELLAAQAAPDPNADQ